MAKPTKNADGKFVLDKNTEDEIKATIQKNTRNYAKRQLTWFRRNESVNWIYADAQVPLTVQAQEIIKEKFSF